VQLAWWERLGVPLSAAVPGHAADRRVLLISHNAFLRRVVAEFLAQAGATVETRPHVEAALQAPLPDVDLILAEQALPRESGLSLLKRLRTGQSGFAPALPFVLIVDAAERWLVNAALDLDANGCVLLPVNAQKIDEALKHALQREYSKPGPEFYGSVSVEAPRAAPVTARSVSPVAELPQCFGRALPGSRLVPMHQLSAGMTLGADLQTGRGVVLLAAGTALDSAVVERLRQAAQAFGFDAVPAVEQGA
jgi:DNA-binding NarL/FixJ family response regulator